jgi:putative FmdB family regulatory protein
MPIYEYRCPDCSAEFEELTGSANGDAAVTCRQCASVRVTRILSTFAVRGNNGAAALEPGPCGACGAPRRGTCSTD